MALKHEIQTPSGIRVNYHRIVSANINWLTKRINFSVASYLSEYMRRNDKDPVETMDITIELETHKSLNEVSLLKTLYVWLKVNAVGFENAEDC